MSQPDAPLRRGLSEDQRARAEAFLAEFGDDAFELAMSSGPFVTGLRAASRWAYVTALGAYENGVSAILLTRVKSAKRPLERLEHRLLSGDATLMVDFPHAN